MKISTALIALVIIVILGGGIYWWAGMSGAPANNLEESTATTTPSAGGAEGGPYAYVPGNLLLGTDATSTLGTYLIASNGMTLYKYTKDTPGVSSCSGECAVNWPPYTIESRDALANVQAGIPGEVDAITRADGSLQVTYDGMPLYFWVNDHVSGDTTGQNVGGVWFVVKP
jgi:predicted lipoprotein with Yx(FWY)xxD motif